MDRVLNLVLLSGAASVGAALLAVALLLFRMRQLARKRAAPPGGTRGTRTIFLTEDRVLLDATEAGREFLTCRGSDGSDFDRLERALSETFPDFAAAMRRTDAPRITRLTSPNGLQTLTIGREGPRLRLELASSEGDLVTMDRGCYATLESELGALRGIGDGLPYPVWRQDADGRINWANAAYMQLARDRDPAGAMTWPPPALFGRIDIRIARQRLQLSDHADADSGWFDCACMATDAGALVSAIPTDALMAAEASLRESVQTFSRTFAHLTVGMAVFDRHRRLQLFNPALANLTTLPMDLLVARPTLDTFLDALRARKMMPEPRSYTSWREAVARVERAAADGTYNEMWHLPGTRTYRVTGRPQPDGAFALLVEDISAEISLTRRFRTEIQTGQAVLNTLGDAIAVFDGAGILILSNAAYDALWNIETLDGVTQLTVHQALAVWTTATRPTPLWDAARIHLSHDTGRAGWSGEVEMLDGRAVAVRLTPLPGGAIVARFNMSAGAGRVAPARDAEGDRVPRRLKA